MNNNKYQWYRWCSYPAWKFPHSMIHMRGRRWSKVECFHSFQVILDKKDEQQQISTMQLSSLEISPQYDSYERTQMKQSRLFSVISDQQREKRWTTTDINDAVIQLGNFPTVWFIWEHADEAKSNVFTHFRSSWIKRWTTTNISDTDNAVIQLGNFPTVWFIWEDADEVKSNVLTHFRSSMKKRWISTNFTVIDDAYVFVQDQIRFLQ